MPSRDYRWLLRAAYHPFDFEPNHHNFQATTCAILGKAGPQVGPAHRITHHLTAPRCTLQNRLKRVSIIPPAPKIAPQRDRTLGSLFKDERLATLDQLDGYSTHGQVRG